MINLDNLDKLRNSCADIVRICTALERSLEREDLEDIHGELWYINGVYRSAFHTLENQLNKEIKTSRISSVAE